MLKRIKLIALSSVSLMAMVACTTPAQYELCDTPDCGDPVDIKVE